MTRICLDTSAYSQLLLGEPQVVPIVRTAERVVLPVIVLGELRTGFRLGSREVANERSLRAFLAEPAVEIADVDEEASSLYAQLTVDLRRAGTPVAANDLWIAAVAMREGATVLTYDRDFARVRGVGVHVLHAHQAGRD